MNRTLTVELRNMQGGERIQRDGETLEIAWIGAAREQAVQNVLAAPVDDDGRSEWCWIRMANGDLFLAVAPRGGLYEELEGEPGAGWGDPGEDSGASAGASEAAAREAAIAEARAAAVAIAVGQRYEFVSEVLEEYEPAEQRLRNYTGQQALVVEGPLGPEHNDPENSPLYRVRFDDGREAQAHEEELSGWDKALGQFYGPAGIWGDPS